VDLSNALLEWFDEHARELPWRSDPTPYKVLLSELMLQQTRVETVVPYFLRFTSRWPTLADLARATEDDVIEAWAGLGYYSRARNLRKAAITAVRGGGLVGDVGALRALPGVGPYTAGAIASIAFGVQTPLVDGNVERVLSRLDARDADPRSGPGRKALWARAGQLVPASRPGDFNQALMELGATVCHTRRPACMRCPWAAHCAARASGEMEAYPRRAQKSPPRQIAWVGAWMERERRVLVRRRPATGLLAGLWELPGGIGASRDDLSRLLPDARVGSQVGVVTHVFTHRRLTLRLFSATPVADGNGRWIDPENPDVAVSALLRKCLAIGQPPPLPLAAEDHRRG
jgi:A/G-specific adenine glycosylase